MDAETQEVKQARYRASVKWLVSKAFNNRAPDNIKEPFYCDQENQQRLKPQIIVDMANATLYCQTLSNLYSDPNYESLNHWSILQTLARKGIAATELPDTPLTETVLRQTNPLRINAHMCVIESLMILYTKEIVSEDRVSNVINRISGNVYNPVKGQPLEAPLLAWISYVCAALKKRIDEDILADVTDETKVRLQSPNIPPVRDFQDLCDGICLVLLISYYCPMICPWTRVRINHLPPVEDSIYNILLIKDFCENHLPYNVFHITPEDVTYMRGSMKLNLFVLLSDLFNLFEIHPAKCVYYPEMDKGFIVHKSRGITTLSSVHSQQDGQNEPLFPARLRQSKEKFNTDTKDEKADYAPAGRPSNWEQNRRSSFAGRRSRKNSSSEDSQLTIENFGGSQDQLNVIGQYEKDKERERKLSSASAEPAVAVRSSIIDARGTLQIAYDTDSGSEKQDRDTEKYFVQIHDGSFTNTTPRMSSVSTSHSTGKSIDKNYSKADASDYDVTSVRKYSQSRMPTLNTPYLCNTSEIYEEDGKSLENASKLSNIRIKLEEKRRRIEEDKLKIELALLHHQEKSNLMQTLQQKSQSYGIEQSNGGIGACGDKSESKEGNEINIEDTASVTSSRSNSIDEKQILLIQLQQQQEAIKSDLQNCEALGIDPKGIDPIELEKYQQSIAIMNLNLQDIQHDIQRLATQQNQIQAQHLQAQQLIQAQQIANMLNQQPTYGSQQHLAEHAQQRQNFGSTPHLSKAFNTPMNLNVCNSRPPSRDAYATIQQPHPMQCANEPGQYMHQQPSLMQQPHNMAMQTMYCDNTNSYNNYNTYGMLQYGPLTQQYMNRYDEFGQPVLMRDHNSSHTNQHYVNESSSQTIPPQRRTWTPSPYEQRAQPMVDVNAWQSAKKGHLPVDSYSWERQPSINDNNRAGHAMHHNGNSELFEIHSSSPQQIQYSCDSTVQQSMTNLRDNRYGGTKLLPNVPHSFSDDIMAPQSICFIGDEEDVEEIERDIIESMQNAHISGYNFQQSNKHNTDSRDNLDNFEFNNAPIPQKLNITSGNLTYRIPSPSRPVLHVKNFQDPREQSSNEKGFYISFDDEQPKRPKPPLRPKRSPKKEKSLDNVDHQGSSKSDIRNQKLENAMDFQECKNANNDTNRFINAENKSATYNKHTDPPIQLRQLAAIENSNPTIYDRRHVEDIEKQQQQQKPLSPLNQLSSMNFRQNNIHNNDLKNKALVIGADVTSLDPESVDEMERRKEKIMLLSLQRRQQQEEVKARKEIEAAQKREKEREKEEERVRKKEEQMARRAAILEQHRLKKAMEEAEREGKPFDRSDLNLKQPSHNSTGTLRLRQQRATRPRPKTIHVDDGSMEISEASSISSRSKKGSSTNLTGYGQLSSNSIKPNYYRGSQESLNIKESPDDYPSTSSTPIGRRGSYKTSRAPTVERGRTLSRISVAQGSTLSFRGRKSNSLMNLCGPKLYKQPTAKSNRGIILNAVEYCVFPGVVNRDAKQKVLEKIARSEAKHFLVLFRDAGCQFRALYSYMPEIDQVSKLYGTGPSQVDEIMFDKFFKYNSGGKCFSQVHTKHLTVTIDAFTIHNSLWQGKKVHLPSKKDMALVI